MEKTHIYIFAISFVFILTSIRISSLTVEIPYQISYDNNLPQSSQDFPVLPVTGCTIFTVEFNNEIYFASSEDESGPRKNTRFWFVPAPDESTYGAVYFGFTDNLPGADDIDGLAVGGMNSQGLCFDANGVMPPVYLTPNQGGPARSSISDWEVILQECATVEDVIQWHMTHNMGGWWGNQIHWADATGKAVVISAGRNHHVAFTRKFGDFLISTNFNLDNYSHGSYPCPRYSAVKNNLEYFIDNNDITEKHIQEILRMVHLEGTSSYIGTVYSYIMYPQTRDVVLYIQRDYEYPVRFNLYDELLRGEHEVRIVPDLKSNALSSSSVVTQGFDMVLLYPLIIVLMLSRIKNKRT
ncbi:MAG: hypothetical protein ACFFE8_04910 [Candidatus Heimdallarchaeota archaeon]